MQYIASITIGYLLGVISPSAFFGKRKNVDLKKEGTGNLGASNAWITLGKSYFFIIMVLDIFKSWLAAKIAWKLFPGVAAAGYIASLGAILGHIFPFYLHFKGGKGLAAFGGMVCAYNFWLLLFYMVFGFALIMIFNHSWVMPFMVSLTLPFVVWFGTKDVAVTAVFTAASVVILIAHWDNMVKAFKGTDFSARQLVSERMKDEDK